MSRELSLSYVHTCQLRLLAEPYPIDKARNVLGSCPHGSFLLTATEQLSLEPDRYRVVFTTRFVWACGRCSYEARLKVSVEALAACRGYELDFLRAKMMMDMKKMRWAMEPAKRERLPADPDRIPDVVEALIGWRWFRIRRVTYDGKTRFLLGSMISPGFWLPGTSLVASCWVSSGSHEAPKEGCTCGAYALNSREELLGRLGLWWFSNAESPSDAQTAAFAEVSQWGKVIVGTTGRRSQYAYPKKIYLPRGVPGLRNGPYATGQEDTEWLAEELVQTYNVEVEIIDVRAVQKEQSRTLTGRRSSSTTNRFLAFVEGMAMAPLWLWFWWLWAAGWFAWELATSRDPIFLGIWGTYLAILSSLVVVRIKTRRRTR